MGKNNSKKKEQTHYAKMESIMRKIKNENDAKEKAVKEKAVKEKAANQKNVRSSGDE